MISPVIPSVREKRGSSADHHYLQPIRDAHAEVAGRCKADLVHATDAATRLSDQITSREQAVTVASRLVAVEGDSRDDGGAVHAELGHEIAWDRLSGDLLEVVAAGGHIRVDEVAGVGVAAVLVGLLALDQGVGGWSGQSDGVKGGGHGEDFLEEHDVWC